MAKMSPLLIRSLVAQAGVSVLAVAWAVMSRDVAHPYTVPLLLLPLLFAGAFYLELPLSLPLLRGFCAILGVIGIPVVLLLVLRGLDQRGPSWSLLLLIAQVTISFHLFRILPTRRAGDHLADHSH